MVMISTRWCQAVLTALLASSSPTVAAWAQRATVDADSVRSFHPDSLSAFARAKAVRLLRDRLPCLGCHRLEGEGGIIAPDLSDVGARREAGYIYAMIRDPKARFPGTVMPKIAMREDERRLITNYLVQSSGQLDTSPSPIPTSAEGDPPEMPTDGAQLYSHYCAGCHGPTGRGDGYNASHLPVPATSHADSAYMSTRPDDTLFDGIFAGGRILNRSHRMPGFGQTLTTAEIWALVGHLRTLCRCEGPAWSRDGRRSPWRALR